MPLSLALAAISTAAFIAAAAIASPEWPRHREILSALRAKAEIGKAQGPSLLALATVAIVAGIPASLGFLPVLVLVPFGGIVFLVYVRRRLSEGEDGSGPWWVGILGLSIVSIAVRFETLDAQSVQAAQAVLGPSFVIEPFAAAALSAVAVLAGLVSALFIVSGSPPLPDGLAAGIDPVLRWAETALAVVLVSGTAAGPSLSLLSRGPLDWRLGGSVVASTLFGLAATAGVSFLRRRADQLPEKPIQISCAGLAAGSLLLQLIVT